MVNKCIGSDIVSSIAKPLSQYAVQIRHHIVLLTSLFLCLTLLGCQQAVNNQDPVPSNAFNEDGSVNAYIEIPAGSNMKLEFDESNNRIKPDKMNGKDRVIDFLPYPGNYGFISGTKMETAKGGDGDALDVLVLCDARDSGSSLKIKPIGVILLEDNGKKDHKILAVPFDETKRTINVENFSSFITQYNAAQFIVQEWFMNYKGLGQMKLIGWKDEQYAIKEIEKWSKDDN